MGNPRTKLCGRVGREQMREHEIASFVGSPAGHVHPTNNRVVW